VHSFKGERDTAGLLRSLGPELVIVDSSADAREASAYALDRDAAVLHISVRSRTLRLFQSGAWKQSVRPGPRRPSRSERGRRTLFARGAAG